MRRPIRRRSNHHPTCAPLAVAVVVVVVAAGIAATSGTPASAPVEPPPAPAALPDLTRDAAPERDLARPDPAPALPDGDLVDLVYQLTVDDVGTPTGAYDRDLFPHWAATAGGCDVRGDVLLRDFDGHTLDASGCRPAAGTGQLVSGWDGVVLDDPADVDIDHVRALADAWGAGASAWTTPERTTFANDPADLLAVSSTSNRPSPPSAPTGGSPTTTRPPPASTSTPGPVSPSPTSSPSPPASTTQSSTTPTTADRPAASARRPAIAGGGALSLQRPIGRSRRMDVSTARQRPFTLPERLDQLDGPTAAGAITLPLHIDWSTRRGYDLDSRADRLRVYELVLREGTLADLRRYVDRVELAAVLDELVLPDHIRDGWTRLLAGRVA